MYWPSPTLRWMIVPPIGAETIDSGPILSAFESLPISSSERAEDAQPVAHGRQRDLGRAQVALRAHEVGLGLLEILQRAAADRQQFALALSTVLARSTLDFDFSTPATAVTRSFWPCDELGRLDGEQRRTAA